MKVLNLFYKYQKGKPTTNVHSLNFIKRFGIEGDVHAQWGSPRQLLIVSRQTLEDFAIGEGDLGYSRHTRKISHVVKFRKNCLEKNFEFSA